MAIYKNNEELKKHKRKRYTIEDQENKMGKSNQLTQIQRKKYEIKNDRKKKKQKGELRTEWKGTWVVYKKEENWQKTEKEKE